MTDDVNRQIGQLEGRMGAMEDRQARHETTIAGMFGRIELKQDALAAKMDQFASKQADADGARRERRTITAVLIAAGTAAAAWIGHVTIGSK